MLKMPLITLVYAGLLIATGVAGWALAGGPDASPTALIPAFFGIVIGICGFLAKAPQRRKLFMHIAVVLAFVLAAAAVSRGGLVKLGELSAAEDGQGIAIVSLSVTAAVSMVYLAICIRSFIAARKG